MYKFITKDRKYANWDVIPFCSNQTNPILKHIDPIESKLFHEDVFSHESSIELLKSPVRERPFFAGVLILQGNKTYGRRKNPKKTKPDKLLYKCVPNDYFLPSFLIPYEIKHMGFSKLFNNLYVTFKYDHWEEKHPYGTLLQVIGNVNDLPSFYEYQLYCKQLHTTIHKFEKDTTKSIQKIAEKNNDLFTFIREKYPHDSIEDRTQNNHIFTIDPEGSIDFDDAFSIRKTTTHEENIDHNRTTILLSIYISNVSILLDALELWDSFAERISTIYLPDKKRSMLPSILGDHLCSLREKTTRIAFAMDVYLNFIKDTNGQIDVSIQCIEFKNTLIKVSKNYVYEDPSLLNNVNYRLLYDTLTSLCQQPNRNYLSSIKDSHDTIAYLMIWMNYECSNELLRFKNGIFRSSIADFPKVSPMNEENKSVFPNEIVGLFHNHNGKYVNGEEVESVGELCHSALGLNSYIHITSPIRRLVDLLNLIRIQENRKMIFLSPKAQSFYQNRTSNIDGINKMTKDIRRVQNQCTLLELVTNKPGVLEKIYDGYLLQRENLELGMYSYDVTLPELKIFSKIVTSRVVEEYSRHLFRIYVFNDEESLKKKIRLSLLEETATNNHNKNKETI